jgi:hypothetical protein
MRNTKRISKLRKIGMKVQTYHNLIRTQKGGFNKEDLL